MYKLSNLAAEDFARIYEYTLNNFGVEQADLYTDNIEKCFNSLFLTPFMDRDNSDVKAGIRRHDHGQHAIFYQVKVDYIFVVRILHQQMNPVLHL
ncbi:MULTISPECIES: type II toxin-antitoxin system RelE/ParE family toxin [Photorhabdus]|uniref:Toxin n=2 Tax=Photorhabdus asymbiotica TaxID=291112 RepID=C7BLW7_PHOAA|nr:type II toxin-antitoxin system RelE/ParE family toxin [Photorhabdus asymbiotica]RKS59682.1 toxin ParE1/3/4 [Photorhabdus asymbiotica]CAQ85823.1 conserved hypothetical Protein [Photorhabdus asymbiotica]